MKGRYSYLFGAGFIINIIIAVWLTFKSVHWVMLCASWALVVINLSYFLYAGKYPKELTILNVIAGFVLGPIYGLLGMLGVLATNKGLGLQQLELSSNEEAREIKNHFYIRNMYFLYIAIAFIVFAVIGVLSIPKEAHTLVTAFAIISIIGWGIGFCVFFILNIGKVYVAVSESYLYFKPALTLPLHKVAISALENLEFDNDIYKFTANITGAKVGFCILRSNLNFEDQAVVEKILLNLNK